MTSRNTSQPVSGMAMSPGLAIGQAFIYRDIMDREHETYDIEPTDLTDELRRIDQAVAQAVHDLERIAERVADQIATHMGEIFIAQKLMLQDATFLDDLKSHIEQDLVNAEHVVQHTIKKWSRRFRNMDDETLREKVDDITDVGRRLLRNLAGIQAHQLQDLPEDSIVVSRRLLPSDTVFLSRTSVRGIVLEFGGPASHTAILARELGVPGVGRIPNVLGIIRAGEELLINGDAGQVVVRPSHTQKRQFLKEIKHTRQSHIEARREASKPAITRSDRIIGVGANVSCAEDVRTAMEEGADSIGLYRLEGLYLSREDPPSEQELVDILTESLAPMANRRVVLRLLDVGADKNLPFVTPDSASNPALGRQGVRVLLQYADLLQPQLRAFLRLFQTFNISILVPMVTTIEDMVTIKLAIVREAEALGVQDLPPLGAMVETPAAALDARRLSEHTDFLSIGTNDLTQYTMVADRENAMVADYFLEDHPVILMLIEKVVREARSVHVSICGEMAGKSQMIPSLIDAGVQELSVAPSRIAEVKAQIRTLP